MRWLKWSIVAAVLAIPTAAWAGTKLIDGGCSCSPCPCADCDCNH